MILSLRRVMDEKPTFIGVSNRGLGRIPLRIRFRAVVQRTFLALDADKAVTDFGITGGIGDPEPLIEIRAD